VIYAGSGVVAAVFTRDVVFAALFVLSALCFAASRMSLRRIERRAGEAHQKNEQIVQQL